jgi:outer membrane protein assembly factor BamB
LCVVLLTGRFGWSADWPQFLGPARNGVYPGTDLAKSWPKDGPPLVWQRKVGQGFSGPAVSQGKLVLFHRLEGKEVIECLDANSQAALWHFEYPTGYRDDFGFDEGPRATPTITGDKVYTLGAEGTIHCLDLARGKVLWSISAKDQFHAPKGFFGMVCSPLVVNQNVLVSLGGASAGIVAFDKDSGKLLWKATDDEAGYSSPVSATLEGKMAAVFLTRAGLVVLDPQNGKVQAQLPWRSRNQASVNAATPLVIGDLIFMSASYGTGAALVQLHGSSLTKIWASDDALSNHYATSVSKDGYLYGFHGRQEMGQSFRCIELKTGRVSWSRDDFGAGTVLLAGDHLLVMREDGQLLLLSASPRAYEELARAQVLSNGVRAYPAVADGLFFARSKDTLICLDLRRSGS